MRAAGRCVEDTGRFRLHECFIDGTFFKAQGGGDGIGCTRVGKGVKIMILVDAKGLPVAVCSAPPSFGVNPVSPIAKRPFWLGSDRNLLEVRGLEVGRSGHAQVRIRTVAPPDSSECFQAFEGFPAGQFGEVEFPCEF